MITRRVPCTFATVIACAAACSTERSGSLELVTGGETQVISRAPAVTRLVVDLVPESGDKGTLFSGAPTANVDLGTLDAALGGSIVVTGTAQDGAIVVRGATLGITVGSLDRQNLPVFIQRTQELARMPGTFEDRAAPQLDLAFGRYLFAAGEGRTDARYYDLLALAPPSQVVPTLPRAPESLAIVDTALLLINAVGASSLDLSTAATAEVRAPEGGSFADVAGGQTIYAPDGSAYIVGGTRRTGAASSRFLRVQLGTLTWGTLAVARLGAGATWVEGRGLVVVGGSATGAGIEVVAAESVLGAPLPFASVADTGLGAAPLSTGKLLVAPGPRVFDLTCSTNCAAEVWGTIPVALASAQVFTFRTLQDRAWVVGQEPSGNTRVFETRAGASTEVPLKIPRNRATATPLPTGALGIVGGGSAVIESLIP